MRIGYARVSTGHQNITSQVEALKNSGCEKVYEDKKSGKDLDREGFMDMMLYLRPGDTLVVYALDRLGRNLVEVVQLIEKLRTEMGITIEALSQNLNFDTAHGRLIVNITLSFSQFERELILERAERGMKKARKEGKRWGREKGASKADKSKAVARYNELIAEGCNKGQAAERAGKEFGVSAITIKRYIKSSH